MERRSRTSRIGDESDWQIRAPGDPLRVVTLSHSKAAGELEPAIEIGPTGSTRDFIDVRDVLAEHVVVAEPYNVGRGEETSTEAILASTIRLAGLEGGRDALEEEQGALGREGRILLRDLLDLGDGLPHARDRQLRLPAGGNRPRVYPRH